MTQPQALRPRIVCLAANPSVDRLVEVARLRVAEINRPRRVVVVPGGKGLNVARAAAALGGRVTAVALLGGHAGRWIAEKLAAMELDVRVAWADGETRTCTSIREEARTELTELYEPGPQIAPEAWDRFEEMVSEALAEGDVAALTMSGSLAPGAPADGYARICAAAAAAGVPAMVDSSGAPLALALQARPWLVKVNAAEAAGVTAMDTRSERGVLEAADALLGRGARAVIISRGLAGAIMVEPKATWRLPPPPVLGSYGVGSGDALLAGVSVGIALGEHLPDACARGLAAAAANALIPGAGRLEREDAERLRPGLRPQQLDR